MDKSPITLSLVANLITQQFPQWAQLPITPVDVDGHDNRTFRLSTTMSVRLPSAACYAPQVHKEQTWLPRLALYLSLQIPKPLAIGNPTQEYPWHWSVYTWIEGKSANILMRDDEQLKQIAIDLAQFLNKLHVIDTTHAPIAGAHNFYRGAHPFVYDTETRNAIASLRDHLDVKAVTALWEQALRSCWENTPVWIHGDIAPGNMLINDNNLVAIIDFGCMGIGDPACDLVIAWTWFNNESRKIFKNHVNMDAATWNRARGWALWKALIMLEREEDKTSLVALKQHEIIEILLTQ